MRKGGWKEEEEKEEEEEEEEEGAEVETTSLKISPIILSLQSE